MMKRLTTSIALACLAGPALASPELAETWGAKAAALSAQSAVLLNSARHGGMPALEDDYVIEFERFVLNASRLGSWNDASGGPAAFGCTFRTIGEEAGTQLEVLETAGSARARQTALRQIIVLLGDAQDLSAAAAFAGRHSGERVAATAATSATADACTATPARLSRIAAR